MNCKHGWMWLCMAIAAGCISTRAFAAPTLDLDRFGGWKGKTFAPGPYFRTEQDGERWWLVTPEGNAFLSVGVNFIQFGADAIRGTGKRPYNEHVTAKYGSQEAWAKNVASRFHEWGVNTSAGWSNEDLRGEFPYTLGLTMALPLWTKESVPDFFSPSFEERVQGQAASCAAHATDPYLIGYFLDNELPWSKDHRLSLDLFYGYVRMAADTPGKLRLVQFFQETYPSPAAFNVVWGPDIREWSELANLTSLKPRDGAKARADRNDFTLIAARKYFETSANAIRAQDPNHLILGCRFIWQTSPKAVVQACGEFCDVVSVNFYETGWLGKAILRMYDYSVPRVRQDGGRLRDYFALTQKPVMITEFGFRSKDSGLPNSYPPPYLTQPNVRTQKDRGAKYAHYVSMWAAAPYCVGYHWFQLMDEPKEGRFDGENGNYGLVDIKDDPYPDFIARFSETNHRIWALHSGLEKP